MRSYLSNRGGTPQEASGEFFFVEKPVVVCTGDCKHGMRIRWVISRLISGVVWGT